MSLLLLFVVNVLVDRWLWLVAAADLPFFWSHIRQEVVTKCERSVRLVGVVDEAVSLKPDLLPLLELLFIVVLFSMLRKVLHKPLVNVALSHDGRGKAGKCQRCRS